MLKALIKKLDNLQEWIGDFSIEQETVGRNRMEILVIKDTVTSFLYASFSGF